MSAPLDLEGIRKAWAPYGARHPVALLVAEVERLRAALERISRLNPGSITSDAARRALEGK